MAGLVKCQTSGQGHDLMALVGSSPTSGSGWSGHTLELALNSVSTFLSLPFPRLYSVSPPLKDK